MYITIEFPSGGSSADVERRLTRIEAMLAQIALSQGVELKLENEQMTRMSEAVDKIVAAAQRQTDAVAAVEAAFDKALEEIRAAKDDPEQLEAALANFENNTGRLAAAALKGTAADSGSGPEVQPTPIEVPPAPEPADTTGGTSTDATTPAEGATPGASTPDTTPADSGGSTVAEGGVMPSTPAPGEVPFVEDEELEDDEDDGA